MASLAISVVGDLAVGGLISMFLGAFGVLWQCANDAKIRWVSIHEQKWRGMRTSSATAHTHMAHTHTAAQEHGPQGSWRMLVHGTASAASCNGCPCCVPFSLSRRRSDARRQGRRQERAQEQAASDREELEAVTSSLVIHENDSYELDCELVRGPLLLCPRTRPHRARANAARRAHGIRPMQPGGCNSYGVHTSHAA